MPSASSAKASDKQAACKKLTSLLQKDYGKSVPKLDQPVLETILFAICLEDNTWEAASAGYDQLLKSYFDLNEIRVSSVAEIEETLSNLHEADWKGLRIRAILRHVFENGYSYDFEKLRRLTLDSAQKQLKKIEGLTPFVRNFTLQQILGSHIVCLDKSSVTAAIHLGIVPPDSDEEAAGEFLKAGIKKADAHAFASLLRKLATDPKYTERLQEVPEDEFDVLQVETRFKQLKSPPRRKKPAAAAEPSTKKTSGKAPAKKKTTTKKPAAAKSTTKKPTTQKPAAAKKTTKKKTTTKKTAAKAAPKKAPAKRKK
jgi:endonuclease-3